ncbi:hypothetical protein DH2020_017607 [Rehmannia glutinosa]|uniref:Uncharacterized protein n=1 Tax=Rehmannia glutinosa TaxID=99300 RepID=A0ABR0WRK4_REHGL
MSCFMLPVGVRSSIVQKTASFWWGTKENGSKNIHWKAWKNLVGPKEEGGLGFHDLCSFNKALIAKQLWRIISQPNLLMSKLLKAKYFPKCSLFDANVCSTASWLWRSWLKVRTVLTLGMRFSIGDGKAVKIWESPWIPDSVSFKPNPSFSSQLDLKWVSDLICDDGKSWNNQLIKTNFSNEDLENILKIPLKNPGRKDFLVWHLNPKGNFTVGSSYKAIL